MKKILLSIILLIILAFSTVHAAEWTNSTCETYTVPQGNNTMYIVKLTAVSDGSAGTVTLDSDFSECKSALDGSWFMQLVVDPTGTLTAAPNVVITDETGGTLLDTDDLTTALTTSATIATNETNASIDGTNPPLVFGKLIFTFDDFGDAADSVVIWIYGLK